MTDATYLRLAERSRTRLIQADSAIPALAAASLYERFRASVSRISRRWSSGSSMGGLPRFGAVMTGLYVRTKDLTSPRNVYILSVQ